jgi:HD superfamily phosphodiesterase
VEINVYKGCPVPIRNPDGGVYLVKRAPDPELFLRYLDNLGRFLKESVKASGVEECEERLELVADLIALFYKAPLLEEPIRGMSLSPFKSYLVYRVLKHKFGDELVRKSMKEIFDKIDEASIGMKDIFNILDETSEFADKIIFEIPADTRPGYNLSSLIFHLLAVSALSWSKFRIQGRRRKAILRIASLLHDIGKPIDPVNHVRKSVEIANKLLSGLICDEDLGYVREIIENHHNIDYKGAMKEEISLIREADMFASGMDRLDSIVKASVLRQLAEIDGISEEEAFEKYYKRGVWKNWVELEGKKPGITRELTEKCVKYVLSEEIKAEKEEFLSGVYMVKLDVASIQDFIRESEKLPILSASSYIVDLAVMFNSLRSVQEELPGYPVECFLYSAGGNIIAVAPDVQLQSIEERLEKGFKDYLGFGPLIVRISHAPLYKDYRKIIEELDHGILIEKLSISDKEQENKLIGIERPCDYCKKRPATEVWPPAPQPASQYAEMREEIFYLCEECCERQKFFENRGHMKSKWEGAEVLSKKRISEVFNGRKWKDVSEWIMELIAGHDENPRERDKKSEERYLNIAIIKLDGNLMGAFMARSISLSDALERSARIDMALKRAFKRAIEVIHEGSNEREEARVLLGLQYMGGDDALILAPSWLSYPLSTILLIEFSRNMGYSFDKDLLIYTGATLSIGLVAMPPAHNLWAALDATDLLLEKAKEDGRIPFYMGAIAFDVTEGGLLTGRTAGTRMNELISRGLSSQPWILGPYGVKCDPFRSLRVPPMSQTEMSPKEKADALEVLARTLGMDERYDVLHLSNSELKSLYLNIIKRSYEEYEKAKSKEETDMKKLRRFVRKVEAFPKKFGLSFEDKVYKDVAKAYALYECDNQGFKKIKPLFRWDLLEDLNRLCKILMGGAA